MPIKWGMEKPGMQAGDPLPEHLRALAETLWLKARDAAIMYADAIHNIGRSYSVMLEKNDWGLSSADTNYITSFDTERSQEAIIQDENIKVHKSLPNRITEPWMWITVVMTATEWKNLTRLRLHGDAEVHFQELMKHIGVSMMESTPKELKFGEWHLPYWYEDDDRNIAALVRQGLIPPSEIIRTKCQISTARCARVSYLTQDGKRDFIKDLELFDRLVQGSGFGHWSPHEHVAMSSTKDERSGPYRGWKQFRKLFVNESADA